MGHEIVFKPAFARQGLRLIGANYQLIAPDKAWKKLIVAVADRDLNLLGKISVALCLGVSVEKSEQVWQQLLVQRHCLREGENK